MFYLIANIVKFDWLKKATAATNHTNEKSLWNKKRVLHQSTMGISNEEKMRHEWIGTSQSGIPNWAYQTYVHIQINKYINK